MRARGLRFLGPVVQLEDTPRSERGLWGCESLRDHFDSIVLRTISLSASTRQCKHAPVPARAIMGTRQRKHVSIAKPRPVVSTGECLAHTEAMGVQFPHRALRNTGHGRWGTPCGCGEI